MLGIIQGTLSGCRLQSQLAALRSFRRSYVQVAQRRGSAKTRAIKSQLQDVVEGGLPEIHPAKLMSILQSQEHKKRAKFAQETSDLAHLLRPHLEMYFSDLNKVLTTNPSFLQERLVVLSFLGLDKVKQLENSYTVEQQVSKLLDEDKLPFAVHLCRMAKSRGSVGMNRILQHLVKRSEHTLASKVFQNLKKWGCAPTERTSVILSKVRGKPGSMLKPTEVEKLVKNYEHSMSRARTTDSKLILSNAMLETLTRNSSVTYALAMYNDIPDNGKFSRDSQTYTTMLNMIAHQPTPLSHDLISMRKKIWAEVLLREENGQLKVDSKLVDSYCNSLALQTDPKYFRIILQIRDQYFSDNMDIEPENSTKFPFTSRQFDIFLKSAISTGQYEEGAKLFDSVPNLKHVKLDRENYHNVLRNASKLKNSKPATEAVFKAMLSESRAGNDEVKPTTITITLVWRNYLQSRHDEIDLNGVEHIVQELLPELQIPLDINIFANYVAFYYKVFSSSFGRRPGIDSGFQATGFIRDNLNLLSDVSNQKKHPQRIKKALLNASNICDYTVNHRQSQGIDSDGLEWVKELKVSIQSILKTLGANSSKKLDSTEETGNRNQSKAKK